MNIDINSGSIDVDEDDIKNELGGWISDIAQESCVAHDDFQQLWMNMIERELDDLNGSAKESACGHGQHIYRGLYHAINEWFRTLESYGADEYMQNDYHFNRLIDKRVAELIEDRVKEAVEVEVQRRLRMALGDSGNAIGSTAWLRENYPEHVANDGTPPAPEHDPVLERLIAEEVEIERRVRGEWEWNGE